MKTTLLSNFKNLFFVFGFLFFIINSEAQIITSWTFEPFSNPAASPLPTSGVGTASVVNLGGGTITPGSATGMAGTGCGAQSGTATGAWALNPFDPGTTNETNGVQFNSSTVGYQAITFTWDQRWSNSVANTVRLQYTTDGTTWVPFTMTGLNTTFCNGTINVNGCFESNTTGDEYRRTTVNFTAIAAANNNPNFGVRLLAAHYQTSGQFRQVSAPALVANPLGTWRFDNVSFAGTLLPGPTASVISRVGVIGRCSGTAANLVVNITGGTGPFTVVYRLGATNFTVLNYVSGTNIPITLPNLVSPTNTATVTYILVSVNNANGVAGTGNSGLLNTFNLSRTPNVPTATNLISCPGAFTMTGGSPTGGTYSTGASYSGGTTTFNYTVTTNFGTTCSATSTPDNTFTRRVAPTIISQPVPAGGQSVCQGAPFSSINVGAIATSISYQWWVNSIASTTGATAIPSSNSPTYTPPSTTLGTSYYYVEITGFCPSLVRSSFAGPFIVLPPAVGGTASGDQTVSCGGIPTDLTVSGFTSSVTKWQYATDFAFTTPVDIPLSASATLLSSQIGVIPSTRYYRAVIVDGICSSNSTVVTITLASATTWDGVSWSNGNPSSTTPAIFNGNYNSSGDLNACSVLINSGNVVFGNAITQPSHNLIIQNGLTISGGTLTFESNASLVQVNNVSNSGFINYKRDTTPVRKYDYTYWSSPVDNQILANLSPLTLSDKYFWFNTTIYNWDAVTAPALTPMDIGKGYIIRAPQNFDPVAAAIFTGTFTGTPNNGDYSVDIVKTGINDLNCIGNPYPSAISAKKFIEGNTAAFGASPGTTLYFWTHNTPLTANNYTFSDYAAYNFSGGTGAGIPVPGANNNTPNGMIAAGQAFMIKGVIEGTTTATFNNSMREVGNNSQFFRTNSTTNPERNRVWLELRNNQGFYKQILVGYIANASDGFDNGYDGETIEAGNTVNFYSILENKKLAIQGRSSEFHLEDQIPLGFKSTEAGNFEINLSDFDGLFQNQDVYLEDTLLNIIHNLKESPYTFITEVGIFDTRFALRFTNSGLAISQPVLNSNSIIIYKNSSDQIVLNSSVKKMENIQIFDILGRLLSTEKNLDSTEFILKTPISNSVLLITVELIDNQIINKKFSN